MGSGLWYKALKSSHNRFEWRVMMSYENEILKLAQLKLRDMGLYHGSIDGIPGPKTRMAMVAYKHRQVTDVISDVLLENNDPTWLKIALLECEKNIEEWKGENKNNPEILKYWTATFIREATDEIPWCSAFVNWCMKEAVVERTNAVQARSWLKWGRALDEPQRGCVVVLRRGTGTSTGHVGFFMYEEHDTILVLGGNQSNSINIAPFNKNKVLAYRWCL
jgi:uncharacterized protein (TIGR02594 family)